MLFARSEKNRRMRLLKKGIKRKEDQVREGFDYEMTIAFDLINDLHLAKATKDRTRLFDGKQEFIITPQTGRLIKEWCESGKEPEKELPQLGATAFEQAMKRITSGEKELYEKLKSNYQLAEEQHELIKQFI